MANGSVGGQWRFARQVKKLLNKLTSFQASKREVTTLRSIDPRHGQALVIDNGGCCPVCLLAISNGRFEATDAFSNSFAEFRKLFRAPNTSRAIPKMTSRCMG